VALVLAGVVIGLVVPRIHQSGPSSPGGGGRDGCRAGADVRRLPDGQTSGAEDREGERVHAASAEAWHASVRVAKWSALAGNTAGLAAQIAFIAVLSIGGARVASGAIDVGTLVA
jgi:ATP-binding cassette subfamily C protein